MKPKSSRAVKIPISLYNEELRIIDLCSRRRKLYNRSAALRQIVREWQAAQVKAVIETTGNEADQ